jgi:phosphoribosylformylglycinamidine cyclo-ligase
MTAEAYLSRGVSPTKDDVKKAVAGQSRGLFPGAFCKLVPDMAGDDAYCSSVHADGAGTKASAAYLMYRETGSREWFKGIAQDSLVMNTDDLACIGAVGSFFLSNTIGRNAHRIDGACIAAVIEGYVDCIARLSALGIGVEMTGGETADVGDLVQTLIVDSTVVVRLRRKDVITTSNIRPGDAIVGLSSTGRASYETADNSGMGSNGLTAARHLLLRHDYRARYPETVSETIPEADAYCGRFLVDERLPGSNLTVGEAILSPTRTYLPVVRDLLLGSPGLVHGLIHCTGGGLAKGRDFGDGLVYVKDALFETPPLFEAIRSSGGIAPAEMYKVFNMGHRLEVYCDPDDAGAVVSAAARHGIEARVIGHVEGSTDGRNRVVVRDRGQEHVYA